MTEKITMPSGAELCVTMAPFAVAKALYMALAEELKSLKIEATTEIDVNFFKDIFLTGLSSKKIDAALAECMKRATYKDQKIDDQTFESVDARSDYLQACFEVARINIVPFTKNLLQKYEVLFREVIAKSQVFGSKKVTS